MRNPVAPVNKMSTKFWTWPIATYLFLGGLGGGTIFMAAIYFFIGLSYEAQGLPIEYGPAAPLGFGIIVGVVMLALGCLLLIFELGQPKLFTRAFIAKTAIIKWGAVLLSVAMICAILWWAVYYWPPEWNLFWYSWTGFGNLMAVLAMVASMGLMIYTGILLSSMKSRPFWNTPAVPILFTISAMSTGCVLLSLCLHGAPFDWWMFRTYQESPLVEMMLGVSMYDYVYDGLHQLDTILVIAEIIVLLLLVIMQYSSSNVTAKSVARRWLAGETKWIFWIGMVLIGLLVPLFCYLSGNEMLAGGLAPVCALLGGLLLRFLFVYNNDRRGIPGEAKYYDRLPDKDDPIFNPYWEQNGSIY